VALTSQGHKGLWPTESLDLKPSIKVYDAKWQQRAKWCEAKNFQPHSPSVPNISSFLLDLFYQWLLVSTIMGYRSVLSSALMFHLDLDVPTIQSFQPWYRASSRLGLWHLTWSWSGIWMWFMVLDGQAFWASPWWTSLISHGRQLTSFWPEKRGAPCSHFQKSHLSKWSLSYYSLPWSGLHIQNQE